MDAFLFRAIFFLEVKALDKFPKAFTDTLTGDYFCIFCLNQLQI